MDKSKLYCYVDETGQDTKGELFIVVVILVTGDKKDQLESDLELIEVQSGKGKRKWIKVRQKEKCRYLTLIQDIKGTKGTVFYSEYINTTEYEEVTVLTIENAINWYTYQNKIHEYKATIVIDGLNKRVGERISASLRKAGIKIRKVRGERDESNALIRLADAFAGGIREAKEVEAMVRARIFSLIKEMILIEIKP
jgi:hypothetical protein